MRKEKKYWLILEPYSYFQITGDDLMIANTISNKVLVFRNKPKLVSFFFSRCQLIRQEDLNNNEVCDFINKIKANEMGDIMDTHYSNDLPVSIMPKLNFRIDVLKESIKNYQFWPWECTIYLTSKCDHNCNICHSAYKQFKYCTSLKQDSELNIAQIYNFLNVIYENNKPAVINIIGGNVLNYKYLSPLLEKLKELPATKKFFINYKHVNDRINDFTGFFIKQNSVFVILVEMPADVKNLTNVKNILKSRQILHLYQFVIKSSDDFETVEKTIADQNIENYSISPFYDGTNMSFFEDEIFRDEEDIQSTVPSLSEIYLKGEINSSEINSLTILSNGSIYSNINGSEIGNISTFKMSMMPYNNNNWGTLRNRLNTCRDCIYNVLCPPISNYEYAIGRNNLCLI